MQQTDWFYGGTNIRTLAGQLLQDTAIPIVTSRSAPIQPTELSIIELVNAIDGMLIYTALYKGRIVTAQVISPSKDEAAAAALLVQLSILNKLRPYPHVRHLIGAGYLSEYQSVAPKIMVLMESHEETASPLSEYLKADISWVERLLLLKNIAFILQHLHQHRIVHRCLSLSAIFLDLHQEALLILSEDVTTATHLDRLLTPATADAPAAPAAGAGIAENIHSFGQVLLQFMLRPEHWASSAERLSNSMLVRGCPERLEALFSWCVDANPVDRPTAEDVVNELANVLQNLQAAEGPEEQQEEGVMGADDRAADSDDDSDYSAPPPPPPTVPISPAPPPKGPPPAVRRESMVKLGAPPPPPIMVKSPPAKAVEYAKRHSMLALGPAPKPPAPVPAPVAAAPQVPVAIEDKISGVMELFPAAPTVPAPQLEAEHAAVAKGRRKSVLLPEEWNTLGNAQKVPFAQAPPQGSEEEEDDELVYMDYDQADEQQEQEEEEEQEERLPMYDMTAGPTTEEAEHQEEQEQQQEQEQEYDAAYQQQWMASYHADIEEEAALEDAPAPAPVRQQSVYVDYTVYQSHDTSTFYTANSATAVPLPKARRRGSQDDSMVNYKQQLLTSTAGVQKGLLAIPRKLTPVPAPAPVPVLTVETVLSSTKQALYDLLVGLDKQIDFLEAAAQSAPAPSSVLRPMLTEIMLSIRLIQSQVEYVNTGLLGNAPIREEEEMHALGAMDQADQAAQAPLQAPVPEAKAVAESAEPLQRRSLRGIFDEEIPSDAPPEEVEISGLRDTVSPLTVDESIPAPAPVLAPVQHAVVPRPELAPIPHAPQVLAPAPIPVVVPVPVLVPAAPQPVEPATEAEAPVPVPVIADAVPEPTVAVVAREPVAAHIVRFVEEVHVIEPRAEVREPIPAPEEAPLPVPVPDIPVETAAAIVDAPEEAPQPVETIAPAAAHPPAIVTESPADPITMAPAPSPPKSPSFLGLINFARQASASGHRAPSVVHLTADVVDRRPRFVRMSSQTDNQVQGQMHGVMTIDVEGSGIGQGMEEEKTADPLPVPVPVSVSVPSSPPSPAAPIGSISPSMSPRRAMDNGPSPLALSPLMRSMRSPSGLAAADQFFHQVQQLDRAYTHAQGLLANPYTPRASPAYSPHPQAFSPHAQRSPIEQPVKELNGALQSFLVVINKCQEASSKAQTLLQTIDSLSPSRSSSRSSSRTPSQRSKSPADSRRKGSPSWVDRLHHTHTFSSGGSQSTHTSRWK